MQENYSDIPAGCQDWVGYEILSGIYVLWGSQDWIWILDIEGDMSPWGYAQVVYVWVVYLMIKCQGETKLNNV